jgi:hypothetical protein
MTAFPEINFQVPTNGILFCARQKILHNSNAIVKNNFVRLLIDLVGDQMASEGAVRFAGVR